MKREERFARLSFFWNLIEIVKIYLQFLRLLVRVFISEIFLSISKISRFYSKSRSPKPVSSRQSAIEIEPGVNNILVRPW